MSTSNFRVLNSKNKVSLDLLSKLRQLKKTPTDIIKLDENTREKLVKMFFEFDDDEKIICNHVSIPADIITADTIPVHDLIIDGEYQTPNSPENHYEYHITIFDKNDRIPLRYLLMNDEGKVDSNSLCIMDINDINIQEHLSRTDSELVVGTLTMIESLYEGSGNGFSDKRAGYMTCSIPIMQYQDSIAIPSIIYDLHQVDLRRNEDRALTIDGEYDVINMPSINIGGYGPHLVRAARDALSIFYAIECSLLNPVIAEVFSRNSTPTPVDVNKSHNPSSKKKTKIKYLKKHVLRIDDIDAALVKRGFVRRTMIWYVTGHWRQLHNGKRIFIQGYWKGALRKSKETLFPDLESRERELVTEKEENHESR